MTTRKESNLHILSMYSKTIGSIALCQIPCPLRGIWEHILERFTLIGNGSSCTFLRVFAGVSVIPYHVSLTPVLPVTLVFNQSPWRREKGPVPCADAAKNSGAQAEKVPKAGAET